MTTRVRYKTWEVAGEAGVPIDILYGSGWTQGRNKGAQPLTQDAPRAAWLRVSRVTNGSAVPAAQIRYDDLNRGEVIPFSAATVPLDLPPLQLPPLDLRDVVWRPRLEATWLPNVTTFQVEAWYLEEDKS